MADEPTQAEKLAALDNDLLLKRGPAYSHVVELYDDTRPHGRFAIGARQPLAEHPRQPPGSPWSGVPALNGPDPLGYSVDAMEPVGSPAEVEASIKRLEAATQLAPSSPCVAATVAGAASPTIRRRC
jgi:hypothetical protein